MRVILDMIRNSRLSKKEDKRIEKAFIGEIDIIDEVGITIFLYDKMETVITISEEDLLENIPDGLADKIADNLGR